jgi:hypothetical protein
MFGFTWRNVQDAVTASGTTAAVTIAAMAVRFIAVSSRCSC